MENEFIVIDTCVLIDYFRKTKKETAFFEKLLRFDIPICLSVISHLEIMVGNTGKQSDFWKMLLDEIPVIDYQFQLNTIAAQIHRELKTKNKVVPFQDLLVAATSIHYGYPLATLNRKHFQHIRGIRLLTPDLFS